MRTFDDVIGVHRPYFRCEPFISTRYHCLPSTIFTGRAVSSNSCRAPSARSRSVIGSIAKQSTIQSDGVSVLLGGRWGVSGCWQPKTNNAVAHSRRKVGRSANPDLPALLPDDLHHTRRRKSEGLLNRRRTNRSPSVEFAPMYSQARFQANRAYEASHESKLHPPSRCLTH